MPPLFLSRLLALFTFTLVFGLLGCAAAVAGSRPGRTLCLPDLLAASMPLGLSTGIVALTALSALGMVLTTPRIVAVLGSLGVALLGLAAINIWRGGVRVGGLAPHSLREAGRVAGLLVLLLAVKVGQISNVFVPNWVDGLVHATLVQKLAAQGSIPVENIYHIGFHAAALLVRAAWNLPTGDAVLLLGQWLSAAAGIAPYVLLRRYVRSRYAALFSLVLYALVLLFPSYLVAWGRYPFLLGLALLPLAIWKTQEALVRRMPDYATTALVLIALALAHYGALLIWLAFVLAYAAAMLLQGGHGLQRHRLRLLRRVLAVTLPLALVIGPKLVSLLGHPGTLGVMLSRENAADSPDTDLFALGLMLAHDGFLFIFWLVAAALAAPWRRRSFWFLLLWTGAAWLLVWVQYKLLGLSASTYLNVLIFSSLPFAICCAIVLHDLLAADQATSPVDPRIGQALSTHAGLAALMLIAVAGGAYANLHTIKADTILFTRSDWEAIAWIRANTPADSTFLIRSFPWGDALVPVDGGGWLPILAGRKSVYPKAIGEFYDACGYVKAAGADYIYLSSSGPDDALGYYLSDFAGETRTVYDNGVVQIVAVSCR